VRAGYANFASPLSRLIACSRPEALLRIKSSTNNYSHLCARKQFDHLCFSMVITVSTSEKEFPIDIRKLLCWLLFLYASCPTQTRHNRKHNNSKPIASLSLFTPLLLVTCIITVSDHVYSSTIRFHRPREGQIYRTMSHEISQVLWHPLHFRKNLLQRCCGYM